MLNKIKKESPDVIVFGENFNCPYMSLQLPEYPE